MEVRAVDKTKQEGQENPELTFTYKESDFKLNDNKKIIEDPPVPFVDADKNTPYGQVEIGFLGNENDPRYTFTHIKGTLNILPSKKEVQYGEPPFNIPISTGVRAWTDPEGIIELGTDDNGNVIATILKGGDTRIIIDGLSYWIQVSVEKANLRVWVNDTTRIQGTQNPKFKIRYDGFQYDDDESIFKDTPFRGECAAEQWYRQGIYEILIVGGPNTNNHPKYNFDIRSGFMEITAGKQLPTAFTPNGDGFNDIWPWTESNYKVQIFNRLGVLIYTGNNGWDGRYNNRLAAPGVYYYIATSPPEEGGKGGVVYSGSVEIVRSR